MGSCPESCSCLDRALNTITLWPLPLRLPTCKIIFLYYVSGEFINNVWCFWPCILVVFCVIPACSVLVVCSEGVIQCFFMVELEDVVCVFTLWSIRQLHSKTLQWKTFRCHFILQMQTFERTRERERETKRSNVCRDCATVCICWY